MQGCSKTYSPAVCALIAWGCSVLIWVLILWPVRRIIWESGLAWPIGGVLVACYVLFLLFFGDIRDAWKDEGGEHGGDSAAGD